MLEVTYSTPRSGKPITKLMSATDFPIETIIKLVQTGVTVTINSAPNTTSLVSSILDREVDIQELIRLHRK